MDPTAKYDQSSWVSKILFWWVIPLVRLGNKREVKPDDIYKIPLASSAENLENLVAGHWEEELKRTNPQLSRAIYKTFAYPFAKVVLLVGFRELICRIGQVYCLLLILGTLERTYEIEAGNIGFGVLLLLLFLNACTTQLSHFRALELSMDVRVSLTTMIYRKVLRLSLGTSNLGQMSNLISNDLNRFDRNMVVMSYLFVAPLQFLLVGWLFWTYIGFSALGGLAFLLLLPPTQLMVGNLFKKLRQACAIRADHRVRMMTELINGIQYIKMSTWEEPFSSIIGKARWIEMKEYLKRHRIMFTNLSILEFTVKLSQFLTILVYVLCGNELTAQKVFMMTAALNFLGQSFTISFPYAMSGYFECSATFQRVQEFLFLDENVSRSNMVTESDNNAGIEKREVLELSHYNMSWSSGNKPVLADVSLKLEMGQLVAIIGPVGSGKTSILNSILGEMPSTSGSINISTRKIAYVSQDPWIFPGTLLENILFGQEYKEEWFRRVVDACALVPDIAEMAHGANEMLGDRGITLSGGQKSRVNLARAVYANDDIYLLDDPLSGVDANVAQVIVSKCIRGLLKSKAVLMVTHQVQHLQFANEIIVLRGGRVDHRGSYTEVMEGDIASFGLHDVPVDVIAEESNSSLILSELSDTSEKEKSYGTFVVSKGIEVEEGRGQGSSKLSLHWGFWLSRGACAATLVALLFIFTQIMDSSANYWLKLWVHAEEDSSKKLSEETMEFDIYVYLILILGFGIAAICRNLIFVQVGMNISEILHNRVLNSLIRAPMSFFQANNPGRVLNRITFDVGVMDDYLLPWYRMTVIPLIQGIGYIVLCGIVYPYILIPAILMFFTFFKTRKFYIKSGSSIKRIDSVARSPVFGILSSTLSGLATIRASKSETAMVQQFFKFQNTHSAAFFCYLGAARLYAFLLDLTTTAYVFILIIYCILMEKYGETHGADTAAVGLVLSSALTLSNVFSATSSSSTDLENGMISVERIFEYSNIKPEAPLRVPERRPPTSWPTSGRIQLSNVSLRYGTNAPVLHKLNCTIEPKTKVGIVGRTGAGKSSLVSALFRLEELCQGTIHLDSVDVSKIGLHDIRSNIFNIPQNPMLFLGTLRKNLDPFQRYSDDRLWIAVKEVELANRFAPPTGKGLDTEISDEGKNLSPGERQLLCLARALIEQAQVLVLDEATAHVDNETEAIIQKTIREKFREQTVITIAHRLSTVINNDKILLLDNGRILEYDHPHILLQKVDGYFSTLCQRTGIEMNARFQAIAKESFEKRNA